MAEDKQAGTHWYALRTTLQGEKEACEHLDDVGVAEVWLPRFQSNYGLRYQKGQLLFPGYVLFRAQPDPDLFDLVCDHVKVAYVLGSGNNIGSPIPEDEITIIRQLAASPYTELVERMPEKGRKARVIDGPLAKVEGVITDCNKSKVRIRTLVGIFGQVVEITVRPDQVETLDYWAEDGAKKKPRHRAGRRVRRSLGARPAA